MPKSRAKSLTGLWRNDENRGGRRRHALHKARLKDRHEAGDLSSTACFQGRWFYLVELLVVITIIGILIGLLLPAVQSAREAGRRTQCMNNIRNLALGFQQHLTDHGFYPSGGWGWFWMGDPDRPCNGEQPGSWSYNVLPYVEQSALHELGRDNNPYSITATKQAGNTQATWANRPSSWITERPFTIPKGTRRVGQGRGGLVGRRKPGQIRDRRPTNTRFACPTLRVSFFPESHKVV